MNKIDFIHEKYNFKKNNNLEKLETIFFNEINASVVTKNSFDENYEIKELNVGSIYDLNVILINRHPNDELKVKVTIVDDESNLYLAYKVKSPFTTSVSNDHFCVHA